MHSHVFSFLIKGIMGYAPLSEPNSCSSFRYFINVLDIYLRQMYYMFKADVLNIFLNLEVTKWNR